MHKQNVTVHIKESTMRKFDTFFSYAGEDEVFAKELVGALKAKGFRVWYAPINLIAGEKLLDSIEKGMEQSSSGILLISSAYLKKGWTNYEMDTLIRKSIDNKIKIFPLWHNVDKKEVENRHSGLAGIISIKTNIGMPILVSKLTEVLSKFAPSIGIIPSYESPKFRFLQGRGEINIGVNGQATTLWEFLLYAKDNEYPLYLEGDLFNKHDLLFRAATLLPHIPDVVKKWVKKEGYQKIWEMCKESGFDPNNF